MSTIKINNANIPLDLYRQIHKTMPILCVDIVIKRGKEFLLVKRSNKPAKGLWWFPGGRVLKGETAAQAAIRKTKQETGIAVKKVKALGFDETIFSDGPFGWGTHTFNAVFSAELSAGIGSLKLDNQSEEYRWFRGAKKDFHPYIKKFIKLAR